MSKEPLVSVIIPSYNHEKYISEALFSVIHQTYPHIEIILIDDGSKDKTADIAEQILSSCKRPYKLIRQANQGAHKVINAGLNLANGDFLSILNSDDYYHLDRITILLNALLEKNKNFAFTKVRYVNSKSTEIPESHPTVRVYRNALRHKELFPTCSFELLIYNFSVTTGNFFFKKTLFQKVGNFNDFKFCHDWDFILRTLVHEEPLYIETPLINYRLHGANTITATDKLSASRNKAEEETEALLLNYFRETQTSSNNLAPCQKNWGSYWPYFSKKYLLPIISISRLKPYFA